MVVNVLSSWRAGAVAGLLLGAGLAACSAEPSNGREPYPSNGYVSQAGNGASLTFPNQTTNANNVSQQQPTQPSTMTQQPIDQPVTTPLPAGEQPMPCNVAQNVGTHCGPCHGAQQNWGAPMPLLTYDDFHADAPLSVGRKVYEVAAERIVKAASPMPPTGVVPADMIAPLSNWLAAGAPAGTAEDANCLVTVPLGMDPTMQEPTPPLPEDATCYQFLNHGGQTLADKDTPYPVPAGEHYVEFYFDVPWSEESAAVNWRTVYDNTQVLHHWLMYSGSTGSVGGQPGASMRSLGSHTGQGVELIAGWAVGGNDVKMPAGIFMQMPSPGKRLLIEWHYFNQSGANATDHSGVEVCVVPKSTVDPKKLASMTWLGTENFNGLLGMPPGAQSSFSGTCVPSRTGLGPDETIKIFGWIPHMHLLGINMKTVVNRANGSQDTIFDEPFQFDRQLFHPQEPVAEIFPGDTLTATCTYFNSTAASVAYGPSTTQEMCYQFTFAYPARALENGVVGLSGATNTCW